MIKEKYIIPFGIKTANKTGEQYSDIIEIYCDKNDILNILMRFNNASFILDEYKASFRYAGDNVHDLILIKDERIFVVTNLNQVFNDAYNALCKILVQEKFNQIVEFDFESMNNYILNKDEIEDEFGEK